MRHVTPKIFHLAETEIDDAGVGDFLTHHGVQDWDTDSFSDGEYLIEIAGRRCYQAWQTESVPVSEKNPNLSKVREGNRTYIKNILKSRHGSVLEHATVTYAIEDVSRVFTHEVVRHRLCAFSQESLRFVRPTSLRTYFPNVFKDLPNERAVLELFNQTITDLEEVQQKLVNILGLDTVQRTFSEKKALQSAMRRLMPIGMATGIIVTTNHRNWRHLIEMRTAKGAEEEIRLVFQLIAHDLIMHHHSIYQDMKTNVDGEFFFAYGRV